MGMGYTLSMDLAPHLAAGIVIGTALAAWWSWRRPARLSAMQTPWAGLAALAVLAFGLFDWGLLEALPLLGLSFGPVGPAMLGISGIRLCILITVLISLAAWRTLFYFKGPASSAEADQNKPPEGAGSLQNGRREPASIHIRPFYKAQRAGLAALLLLNLVVLACEVDGLYIEPFDLRTTELRLENPAVTRPLRIIHLSDIHVERITRREIEMIQRVRESQPDLILMTGDYLNIDYNDDPRTIQDGRAVLAQLSAPYGVYAIPGSPPVDIPESMHQIFDGLNITLLEDEARALDIGGQSLYLVGVSVGGARPDAATMRELLAQAPPGAYSILLYHSPDLADAAARAGIDLYLAGHTHGGQVRLPIWGALVTSSAYGKRFEAGRYQLGKTTLYVSRGIGLEGLRLPRVRFLCPPEIVSIQLTPPVLSAKNIP